MRIQFSGALITLQPVVLSWAEDYSFEKAPYVVAGYTTFDVICIGGGGGNGGGADGPDTNNPNIHLRSYGGEGGGGGFHRVRGLLSVLPDVVPIQVGGAGFDGGGNLGSNSDGGDGGPSLFGDLAAASGGKGGLRVLTRSIVESPGSDGGEGGCGQRTVPGGGAFGGVAGQLGPQVSGSPGEDGWLETGVGRGGGGGGGGIGKYGGVTQLLATPGGRGSYDPSDPSVYGPAGAIGNDPISGAQGIVPGLASGARITPFDGSNRVYGQSGMAGFVALRLTVEPV